MLPPMGYTFAHDCHVLFRKARNLSLCLLVVGSELAEQWSNMNEAVERWGDAVLCGQGMVALEMGGSLFAAPSRQRVGH